MDKILITGAHSGLGTVLARVLTQHFEVIATDSLSMDVTDLNAVENVIGQARPDYVIHCAALVNADMVQQNQKLAYAVNVQGTENVAKACRQFGAQMVFFSSDYVFDGTLDRPYEVDDLICPINYYGITKVLAEQIIRDLLERYYTIRVSWLFGPAGNTFFQKMLQKASEPEVRVVDDQIGSPTYTPHLSAAVEQLIQTGQYGTYHITNEGYCSWADYAAEIFRLIGSNTKVIRVSSSDYYTPAKRPLNSRLCRDAAYSAGVTPLPEWRSALREALENYSGSWNDREKIKSL